MVLSERDVIVYLDDLLFRMANSATSLEYDAKKFYYMVSDILLTNKLKNGDIALKLSRLVTSPTSLFNMNIIYEPNVYLTDKLVELCIANIDRILKFDEELNGECESNPDALSRLSPAQVANREVQSANLTVVKRLVTACLIQGVSDKVITGETEDILLLLLLNLDMLTEDRLISIKASKRIMNMLNQTLVHAVSAILTSDPDITYAADIDMTAFIHKYYDIPFYRLVKKQGIYRDMSKLSYVTTDTERALLGHIDQRIADVYFNNPMTLHTLFYYIRRRRSEKFARQLDSIVELYARVLRLRKVEYTEDECYMEDSNRFFHHISNLVIGVESFYTDNTMVKFNEVLRDFLIECPTAIEKPTILANLISDVNKLVYNNLGIRDMNDTHLNKLKISAMNMVNDKGIKEYSTPISTEDPAENEYPTEESALYINSLSAVLEAYDKKSASINKAQRKAYGAYKTFQNQASKIDSQLTKFSKIIKNMIFGDKRAEVIEGKKYTPIGILKAILGSVALFSVSKVAFIIALVVRFTLGKKMTENERKKVIMELEAELEIIEEKVEDAKNDGNRQAKYALMRTKTELQNAIRKIKFGMGATTKGMTDTAKSFAAGGANSGQK